MVVIDRDEQWRLIESSVHNRKFPIERQSIVAFEVSGLVNWIIAVLSYN